MMKTRHHYFRWTPRTAKITFIYVGVIPAIMGYIAYKTDVSFAEEYGTRVESLTTQGTLGFPSEAKGRPRLREISSHDAGDVGIVHIKRPAWDRTRGWNSMEREVKPTAFTSLE